MLNLWVILYSVALPDVYIRNPLNFSTKGQSLMTVPFCFVRGRGCCQTDTMNSSSIALNIKVLGDNYVLAIAVYSAILYYYIYERLDFTCLNNLLLGGRYEVSF